MSEVVELDEQIDARWWLPRYRNSRHERVLAVVQRIRNRQVHWRKRDLLHAHLYRNLPILGFSPSQYSVVEPDDGRLTINLIKSKVDTYLSMICRSKPRPMFLTNGGNWSLKKRSKGLERWCEGKFYELDLFDSVLPACVLDTGVFDYGVAKIYIANGEDQEHPDRWDIGVERVAPWELVVDDVEANGGRPRSMYQRKWYDRGQLQAMFPNRKSELADTPARDMDNDDWGRDDTSDQVLVTEAWHLPSAPDAGDGRRSIVVSNCTLWDGPYTFDDFPIKLLHRSPVPQGIRGTSIAAELRPIQIALNQALLDIQDSMAMMSRPKWLVNRTARVEMAHIDDDIGSIIEFDGPTAPQAYAPAPFNPQVMEIINFYFARADDTIGISNMRSTGVVPTNLKSGRAIEVNNDVQDGRFLIASRLYEKFASQKIPHYMIDLARVIAESNPKYAARYQHKTYVQIVEFRDVDMKRDEYVMKTYPASALSLTPSARLDELQDLLDRGAIDMETFRELLDFPDLERALGRLNAGKDLAEKLIERYLDADDPEDDSVYIAPENDWPVAMLKQMFQFAAVQAQLDGVPEENIRLLRNFEVQCANILEKQKADAAPPTPSVPMPAPGAPPAAPSGAPLLEAGANGAPQTPPMM